MHAPYAEVPDHDITLRDQLALDRTILANERTLLAYLRTGLALLAGGVALLHLVNETWAHLLGGVSLPLSAVVAAYGTSRFVRVRRRLRKVGEKS